MTREPSTLEEAAKQNGRGKDEVEVRMQDGFDHSYYFVSASYPSCVLTAGLVLIVDLDVLA